MNRDYGVTLNKLKKTLAPRDNLVFVSNRHERIIHVARTVFPHAERGYGDQHILGNIRAKFIGSTTGLESLVSDNVVHGVRIKKGQHNKKSCRNPIAIRSS
ncbi:unnamed protein product [Cuscuta europaea]|uniref:Uncharacterized protein n=1 Tax=Cuscuta europaea TaxID=41803 RepID=A0A9P0ZZ55_CUSEU|nr:unnamed protein product [Cuscuta europaea]